MALANDFCIISGGQTGADRAALDFAIRAGIAHGGWCPKGRLAEDGPLPPIYELEETTSKQYDQRTRWNVRDSDATLLVTIGRELRGGTGLTATVAERLGKPWLHIAQQETPSATAAGARLRRWIAEHQVSRLNVAGPRRSQEHDVAAYVDALLTAALLTDANVPTDQAPPPQ